MHPVLFRIAGHAVESDGAMYFLAAVVAALYAARIGRRRGWDTDAVLPGLILVVIAAYVGAHLHGALLPWDRFVDDPMSRILRPGGLSFFGGLALGSLTLITFIRRRGLPVGEVMNELAPLAPVLYAFFRVGCLLNGDDYGPPTTLPWGTRFPEGSPPTTERVHPAQIYEILLMVPVFAWLWRRRDAGLPGGALAFEACILMGTERFVVEFWRLGEPWALGLTPAQWLAMALVAIGIAGRYRTTVTGRSRRGPVRR